VQEAKSNVDHYNAPLCQKHSFARIESEELCVISDHELLKLMVYASEDIVFFRCVVKFVALTA